MRRFTLAAVPLIVFALAVSLAAQNSQSRKTLKVVGTTRIGHAKNAP